jgi:putative transposase
MLREWIRGISYHKFPSEEAVYKLLYLESERQEGRWAERRLKGFSEARETLEKMLQERYAPRTQTLTHTS